MMASAGGAPFGDIATGVTRLIETFLDWVVVVAVVTRFASAVVAVRVTVPVLAPTCSPAGSPVTVIGKTPLDGTLPDAGSTVRKG